MAVTRGAIIAGKIGPGLRIKLNKSILRVEPPNLVGLKPGEAGEEWVAYLYRKKGFEIIARNYALFGKKQFGEIDIVSCQGRTLVLVEVKTRRSERFMPLEETLNFRKQNLLRRMAYLYLQQNPRYRHWEIQVDFAAVLMDEVDNFVKSVKIMENVIEDV